MDQADPTILKTTVTVSQHGSRPAAAPRASALGHRVVLTRPHGAALCIPEPTQLGLTAAGASTRSLLINLGGIYAPGHM